MNSVKRVTVKCGRLRRIFVVPEADADQLKIGDTVQLPGLDRTDFTVAKIEPTTILARFPLPRRIR
jgi:hypothetical protein